MKKQDKYPKNITQKELEDWLENFIESEEMMSNTSKINIRGEEDLKEFNKAMLLEAKKQFQHDFKNDV